MLAGTGADIDACSTRRGGPRGVYHNFDSIHYRNFNSIKKKVIVLPVNSSDSITNNRNY